MNFKKNITRFSTHLKPDQQIVYKKKFFNLIEEWKNLPKKKHKLYYKLYWKLIKFQIKISKKKEKIQKSKWTFKSLDNNKILTNQIIYQNDQLIKHFNNVKKYKSKKPLNVPEKKIFLNLDLLNSSSFYKKIKYNKFQGIRLKGYTGHNEKVLDYYLIDRQFHILSMYRKRVNMLKLK